MFLEACTAFTGRSSSNFGSAACRTRASKIPDVDEVKFEVVRRVAEHFRSRYDVVDIDGVRVLFPQGWGLVRASNTQPVLVLRFEAASQALLDQYRHEVEEVLERAQAA